MFLVKLSRFSFLQMCLCFLTFAQLGHASLSGVWNNITSNFGTISNAFTDISCSYDSDKKRLYATWVDTNTHTAGAAMYEIKTGVWTDITGALSSFSSAQQNVFCSYDSKKKRLFATWGDFTLPQKPKAAVYSVKTQTWTDITGNLAAMMPVFFDVYCTYDVTSKRLYATWSTPDSPYSAQAAVYDPKTNAWSDISAGLSSFGGVNASVFCVYDGQKKRLYATWVGYSGAVTKRPKVAVYHTKTNTWADITGSLSALGLAYVDVFCAYDNNNKRLYATWTGYDSGNQLSPKVAVYSVKTNTWMDITGPLSSLGLSYNDVFCFFDSEKNRLYTTWTGCDPSSYTQLPLKAAVLNTKNNTWTDITGTLGTLGTPLTNGFCTFDSTKQRLYTTWAENHFPFPGKAAFFKVKKSEEPLTKKATAKTREATASRR